MVSNTDIYRAANMLIAQHGADAMIEAANMVDTMLGRGDLEGRAVWRQIRQAIAELQAQPAGLAH